MAIPQNGTAKLIYWILGALLTVLIAVVGFAVELQQAELADTADHLSRVTVLQNDVRERLSSLETGDEGFKEQLDQIRATQLRMDEKLDRILRNR